MVIKIALNNSFAGAGKDSVADYLVEHHGFKKYALSEGIYNVAWDVFDIPKETKPPRKMLHLIGESLREYDKMLWINKTLKAIEEDGHNKVVITDVRKGLEHFYLKEHGFTNVKVFCDDETAVQRLRERDGEDVDVSRILLSPLETELRGVDMKVINNSGAWTDTTRNIEDFLKSLCKSIAIE